MRCLTIFKKTKWTLLALVLSIMTMGVQHAYALPTLQLGIEGGEYFESKTIIVDGTEVVLTQSTFTDQSPFTLQVVGATSPNKIVKIKNIQLYISILESDFKNNRDGTVTVNGTLLTSAFYGTPQPPLTPHGIFPTYYYIVELGEMTFDNYTPDDDNNDVTVFNTQPGETGSDTGEIWEYEIGYSGFFWLHMDLAGVLVTLDKDGHEVEGKWTKAPFSHDADAPTSFVPEPATLTIFGLGLAGLGLMRRRRRTA